MRQLIIDPDSRAVRLVRVLTAKTGGGLAATAHLAAQIIILLLPLVKLIVVHVTVPVINPILATAFLDLGFS